VIYLYIRIFFLLEARAAIRFLSLVVAVIISYAMDDRRYRNDGNKNGEFSNACARAERDGQNVF